jgi:hypothetical protein
MKKLISLAIVALLPSYALAQDEGTGETTGDVTPPVAAATGDSGATKGAFVKGGMGLQFAFPSGGAPTLGLTYFLNDKAAVNVNFGLLLASIAPGGGADRANSGGFSLEAQYRMYTRKGSVATYLAPGIFFSKDPGIDFGDALGAALTFGLGAEFFLWDQFSLGGVTGVALSLENGADGSFKDIVFSTGTSLLYASFYW